MDRIDLWVELQPVEIAGLQNDGPAEASATIRNRVERARNLQRDRFAGCSYRFNADVKVGDLEYYFPLGESEKKALGLLYETLQLSARAYHRIWKVARTIADLAGEESIKEEHLLEAAGYRPGDITAKLQ